jgi:hypothetical protein
MSLDLSPYKTQQFSHSYSGYPTRNSENLNSESTIYSLSTRVEEKAQGQEHSTFLPDKKAVEKESSTQNHFTIAVTDKTISESDFEGNSPDSPRTRARAQTLESMELSKKSRETIGRHSGRHIGPILEKAFFPARAIADCCKRIIEYLEGKDPKEPITQLTYLSLIALKDHVNELVQRIDQIAMHVMASVPLLQKEASVGSIARSASNQNVKSGFLRKASGSDKKTGSTAKSFSPNNGIALKLDSADNLTPKQQVDVMVEECRKIKNLCFEERPFAKISPAEGDWIHEWSKVHVKQARQHSKKILDMFNLLLFRVKLELIALQQERKVGFDEFKKFLSLEKIPLILQGKVEKFLREKVLLNLSMGVCSKANAELLRKWLPIEGSSKDKGTDVDLNNIGPLKFQEKYGTSNLCDAGDFILSKKDFASQGIEWGNFERRNTKLQTEFYLYDCYCQELIAFLAFLSDYKGKQDVEYYKYWIKGLVEIFSKKLEESQYVPMLAYIADAIRNDYLPKLQNLRDEKLTTLLDGCKKTNDGSFIVYRKEDLEANNWKVLMTAPPSASQLEDWERDLTGIFQMFDSKGQPLLALTPLEKNATREKTIDHYNALMAQIECVFSKYVFKDETKTLIAVFREAVLQELESQQLIRSKRSPYLLQQHLEIFSALNPLLVKLYYNELEANHPLIVGIEKRLPKLPPEINVLTIAKYLKTFYQALNQSISNSGLMTLSTSYRYAYPGVPAIINFNGEEWRYRKNEARINENGDIDYRLYRKGLIYHSNLPITQDLTIHVPGLTSKEKMGRSVLNFHYQKLGEIPSELRAKATEALRRIEYLLSLSGFAKANWCKDSTFDPFIDPYAAIDNNKHYGPSVTEDKALI